MSYKLVCSWCMHAYMPEYWLAFSNSENHRKILEWNGCRKILEPVVCGVGVEYLCVLSYGIPIMLRKQSGLIAYVYCICNTFLPTFSLCMIGYWCKGFCIFPTYLSSTGFISWTNDLLIKIEFCFLDMIRLLFLGVEGSNSWHILVLQANPQVLFKYYRKVYDKRY